MGERVRLQLFEPPLRQRDRDGDGGGTADEVVDVWRWWSTGKRRRYSSTLWVTVEPVVPPRSSEPALRSMLATQPELAQQVGLGGNIWRIF